MTRKMRYSTGNISSIQVSDCSCPVKYSQSRGSGSGRQEHSGRERSSKSLSRPVLTGFPVPQRGRPDISQRRGLCSLYNQGIVCRTKPARQSPAFRFLIPAACGPFFQIFQKELRGDGGIPRGHERFADLAGSSRKKNFLPAIPCLPDTRVTGTLPPINDIATHFDHGRITLHSQKNDCRGRGTQSVPEYHPVLVKLPDDFLFAENGRPDSFCPDDAKRILPAYHEGYHAGHGNPQTIRQPEDGDSRHGREERSF